MISVVVPIFNEQVILPELRRRLVAAMEACGPAWEIVFVNDGSADQSGAMIRQYHADDGRIRLIELSRNFGHQPAITAGVRHARGDCVIIMDGDLQDPPEVISALVGKWAEGYQVVLAERMGRAETGVRGLGFRAFYPLMRWISDLPEGPEAGVFGLMDRCVVEQFNRLPERGRFIPGLRSWLGFRQTSVRYERAARKAGDAKQTLRRLVHYALDAMFSFSYKPLRVATWMGFIVSAVAFGLGVFYFFDFFWKHKQAGSGFTTIILCVLFLGGVQLVCIGILGEYIARIYEEVKQRPLYVVAERVGFNESGSPTAVEDGRHAVAPLSQQDYSSAS